MGTSYLSAVSRAKATFTAGDLREGLEFLPLVYRRAVIFGLEQRLTLQEIMGLSHSEVYSRTLTPFAESAVAHCERHPRLSCVFWHELSDGLISPLLDLEDQVCAAFGGMGWSDLARAYLTMAWLDHEREAEDFLAEAARQGIL